MKEKEYINVSDLARIRAINAIIRLIIPKNSSVIKIRDYNKVTSLLYEWEDQISRAIKVTKT